MAGEPGTQQGRKQAADQHPVDDALLELGSGGEFLIQMDGVVVTHQVCKQADIGIAEGAAEGDGVSHFDFE